MPVTFHEKEHKYTSHTNEVYTSVTQLIKKYVPPFDADYWAAYKALKAVLDDRGLWHEYKKKAGGWENVVAYARYVDKDFAYRKEVIEKKKAILSSWDDKREEAAELGSKYHKMREEAVLSVPPITGPILVYDFNDVALLPDASYPEMLLYNEDWKVAGQTDLVIKRGKVVDLVDYKTSKKIERSGFQNSTLIHPLSHLPNANFYIYALQLSLYARMLELKGLTIGTLTIEHVDRNTQETIELYPVNYYKKEVDELIKHHLSEIKKTKK